MPASTSSARSRCASSSATSRSASRARERLEDPVVRLDRARGARRASCSRSPGRPRSSPTAAGSSASCAAGRASRGSRSESGGWPRARRPRRRSRRRPRTVGRRGARSARARASSSVRQRVARRPLLEHAAQLVDLLEIFDPQLGHEVAAARAVGDLALLLEHAQRLAHGRDAEPERARRPPPG